MKIRTAVLLKGGFQTSWHSRREYALPHQSSRHRLWRRLPTRSPAALIDTNLWAPLLYDFSLILRCRIVNDSLNENKLHLEKQRSSDGQRAVALATEATHTLLLRLCQSSLRAASASCD